MITLPEMDCSRGAPMGRRDFVGDCSGSGQLTLQYIPLFDGGYDEGGAYWGGGQPLILVHGSAGEQEVFRFERGSVEDVLDEMEEEYPYCQIDAGLRDNLIISCALSLFGLAYADQMEDNGTPVTGDILAQLPSYEIDPEAVKLATTVVDELLAANPDVTFDSLRQAVPQLDTLELGHRLAMDSSGYGEGPDWSVRRALTIPSRLHDWNSYSLSRDYTE